MTQRVCIKKAELVKNGYADFEDWASNPKHFYIGRNMSFYVKGANASPLQNPFPVKKYGLQKCLTLFEAHARKTPNVLQLISNIHNYDEIGCWCLQGEECHGDIILKLAEEINES